MFQWSTLYEIQIPAVDVQHRKLFGLINDLAQAIESGTTSSDHVERSFDELLEFAYEHFVDEERIMTQYHVDARHVSLQRMEHQSFIYDVKRMRTYMLGDTRQSETAASLIEFATSWLVYHTLRTDQLLGIQIREMKAGSSPAGAYEAACKRNLQPAVYHEVVEALLHLWTDAMARLASCQQELAELQGQTHPPSDP